jgi:ligand-binding sensor domain-containing protein
MLFNTMTALAHRCLESGEVEVYFGRMGVNSLRYHSDYPLIDAVNFTPYSEDQIFFASQDLEVLDLLFDLEKAALLITSSQGDFLSISTRNIRPPDKTHYDEVLWALSLSPNGDLWIGGTNHLIKDNQEVLNLVDQKGNMPDSRARLLSAGQRWVWFGDSCPVFIENCWVLGAYENGQFFPINLSPRQEVTAITVDSNNVVWIGTENGIILYP